MIEDLEVGSDPLADGYVQFRSVGEQVKGEFRCAGCGYGVAVFAALPSCPMCGGGTWEPSDWSPFSRAGLL